MVCDWRGWQLLDGARVVAAEYGIAWLILDVAGAVIVNSRDGLRYPLVGGRRIRPME